MEDLLMIALWIFVNHTQEAMVRHAVTGNEIVGGHYSWDY